MTLHNPLPALVIFVLAVLSAGDVQAQAFCALRDPVTSIYSTFPDAHSYRSIVKVVNNAARNSVRDRMPLDLHFNELGKHTLYVAMRGDEPIGVIHARSEGDRWGLTEIAWALDLDFRVVDFRFQRSRNPARRALDASQFVERLRGRSLSELRAMLTPDASKLRVPAVPGDDDADSLAATVLRSALKTIIVTEAVWGGDLQSLRASHILNRHFDVGIELQSMPAPYSPDARRVLAAAQLDDELNVDRDSLKMFRVIDEQGDSLGYFFDSVWRVDGEETNLLWLMDDNGVVVDVESGANSAPELRRSLRTLVSFDTSSSDRCSNALELSAFELGVLTRLRSGR